MQRSPLQRAAVWLALVWFACSACLSAPVAAPGDYLALGRDRLHYRVQGDPDGPELLFLGGAALGLEQWDAQVDPFAPAFRVIRYDPRGFGRSSPPSEPFRQVRDLARLLRHLEAQRVILVASGFGGGIAIDFALAYPQRVAALVLCEPAIEGYAWSAEYRQRGKRLAELRQRDGRDAFVAGLLADPHFAPAAQADPQLRERIRRLCIEGYGVYSADLTLMRPEQPPALTRLSELEVPTCVIRGTRGHPDGRAVCRVLLEEVAAAEAHEVEGAGTLVQLERPEEFNALIARFLERVVRSQ